MVANVFPVNSAAINSANQNGVQFVFPTDDSAGDLLIEALSALIERIEALEEGAPVCANVQPCPSPPPPPAVFPDTAGGELDALLAEIDGRIDALESYGNYCPTSPNLPPTAPAGLSAGEAIQAVIAALEARIEALEENGIFCPPTVSGFGWRALRHEDLIRRDGQPATLRVLDDERAFVCIMAEKRLRNKEGSTPLRYQQKMGYVSPVALARVGFLGKIRAGDTITTEEAIWHIDEAFLQKVAGEDVRWVLKISESGTF